jgi:hypothetical protein
MSDPRPTTARVALPLNPRRLDIASLADTAARLEERVCDRFPDRGIATLVAEVGAVTRETHVRVDRLARPWWWLRGLILALVAVTVVALTVGLTRVRLAFVVEGADEWLVILQSGIQDVVFVGIAAVFLAGIESRLKRRDAMAGLHELRSIAHVIDMHQLTKDPDSALHPDLRAAHSPERMLDRFLLGRYLDYCSEMLSLTSKLAALYAQESRDPVVLDAVNGIQDLTGSLSSKIWQKLVILDTLETLDPQRLVDGGREAPSGIGERGA